MQLVVYMNAALDMQKKKHPDKLVIPAGLFYYRMKDPIVNKPTDGTEVEEVILQELKPDGVVQAAEEVLQHFDRDFTGKSQVIPVAKHSQGYLARLLKCYPRKSFN